MQNFMNDTEQMPNYDSVVEDASQQAQHAAPVKAESQEYKAEDKNWKRMREENERYKREAEELKKQLESKRGDDELVEYKQLREMQYRMEQQTLDLRLKSKFPDFDAVVNSETLQKLAKEDPELAYTIDNTPDMYTKAVAAYKMIKAKSSHVQQPSEDDEYFEENQYKPRSTNSLNPQASDRPLSNANAFQRGLSADQKAKLWAEMQEAIKSR